MWPYFFLVLEDRVKCVLFLDVYVMWIWIEWCQRWWLSISFGNTPFHISIQREGHSWMHFSGTQCARGGSRDSNSLPYWVRASWKWGCEFVDIGLQWAPQATWCHYHQYHEDLLFIVGVPNFTPWASEDENVVRHTIIEELHFGKYFSSF